MFTTQMTPLFFRSDVETEIQAYFLQIKLSSSSSSSSSSSCFLARCILCAYRHLPLLLCSHDFKLSSSSSSSGFLWRLANKQKSAFPPPTELECGSLME